MACVICQDLCKKPLQTVEWAEKPLLFDSRRPESNMLSGLMEVETGLSRACGRCQCVVDALFGSISLFRSSLSPLSRSELKAKCSVSVV